ncbi:hypothetical protein NX779_02265 [Mycoplasma cottewii]|uniref:Uncharacterized protein n=1 Tax=Mycoplasma cottewii TaxID=51364 RepID=A0ABY5TVP1_9MOLU|nr:hypothetical protein [Mycoplasma cottewii]UWD34620.1 hypothetical protein NX779_02265 [Mycoplasma cottewii]
MKLNFLKTICLFSTLSTPLIANTLTTKNNIEINNLKFQKQNLTSTPSTLEDFVNPKTVRPLSINFINQKVFNNIGYFFSKEKFLKRFHYLPEEKYTRYVVPNYPLNNPIENTSFNPISPTIKKILSFQIKDHAKSWNVFKQKYPTLTFKFDFESTFLFQSFDFTITDTRLDLTGRTERSYDEIKPSAWKSPNKNSLSQRHFSFNLNDLNSTQTLPELMITNPDWKDNEAPDFPKFKLHSTLSWKLENEIINFYLEQSIDWKSDIPFISSFKSETPTHNGHYYFENFKIFNYLTSTLIEPISITSEFADKDEVNQINKNLNSLRNFKIDMTNQDTHTDISNNNIKNTNPRTPSKYKDKTNKEYLESEAENIIKKAFTVNNVDLWESKYKHKMKYDIEFQPTAQRIKIFFKDLNPEVEPIISRFYNNLLISINLSFHPEFFQKDIQNRITITPSRILDPKTNQLVLDQPEVEVIKQNGQVKGQIFWYHNTVKVEFRAVDGTEQLLVENKPTEVYNNVYYKTLVDKRFLKSESNTTQAKSLDEIKKGLIWNISVNQEDKLNPIDIKIGVRSISPNLSFKWKGWNPENDPSKPENYQQYKLITPNIDNKQNPEYDPTINPTTGTRKEIIWVNTESKVNNFYQDPYDKNDNLNQLGDLANFGYIAEASVVNSGANYIFNNSEPSSFNSIKSAVNDLNKSIGQIQIKKYNDNFTNSENLLNNDKNNALHSFAVSLPGIYHYNVPIKDYVSIKDTFDPKKIQPEDINSEVGSSLHKYLIVNNNKDKYQSFLKIYSDINAKKPVGQKIPTIQSFWSSPAGQHLKFFLIHNQLIKSTNEVNKYSYEEIVSLWNYYVSTVKQGTVVLPHGVARIKPLYNVNFHSIKITATTKVQAVNLIKQSALKQIQQQLKSDQISLDDFEIVDENTKNWNDFLDINNDNKEMIVKFKANPTSLHLSDTSLNVSILNSKNFLFKTNDLSQMNFQNITANFSDYLKRDNTSEETGQEMFVNNYVTQHIYNTIRTHRQNESDLTLQNIDYEIYINNQKLTQFQFKFNLKNQQTIDKVIKEFFENVKTKHFAQLLIEIKSTETTFKLKGSKAYLITHSSNANTAPELPTPFNWPEEQNTPSDNSNPEILKYFDLLLLKTGDWIGDFSKWTIKDFEEKVINNIIKQLTEQSKKPVELNKDFIIRINDNIYNQKVIEDFFKSKGKLKITIQAIIEPINREKVLINSRDIFLHNTLDGKTPEQLTPTTPDSPDNNNNNENNSDNPSNQDKPNQGRKNKWTILAYVGGAILAITGGYFGIVRWRSRKLL